jgi:hypothetical protein
MWFPALAFSLQFLDGLTGSYLVTLMAIFLQFPCISWPHLLTFISCSRIFSAVFRRFDRVLSRYFNGYILAVSLYKLTTYFNIHFDPEDGGSLSLWNDCIHLQDTHCHYRDDQNLSLNMQDSLVAWASLNCLQIDDKLSLSVCQTVKSVCYFSIYQ